MGLLQLTFTMGLSYLPLAQVGLDALEWWSQVLPADIISLYYPDILPCLDMYLKTSDKGVEKQLLYCFFVMIIAE
jgi:DNA-dependent protein kinase catalytic subunit